MVSGTADVAQQRRDERCDAQNPEWYVRLTQLDPLGRVAGGLRCSLRWQALGAIDVEEEEKWTLDELGIDFPAEWASNEFLQGRNW